MIPGEPLIDARPGPCGLLAERVRQVGHGGTRMHGRPRLLHFALPFASSDLVPFTLAHPAAIIPLQKLMGKRASLSALVIGSMIADLPLFVGGVPGSFSHSAAGLLAYCLPAGFIVYLLFHLLLKLPTIELRYCNTLYTWNCVPWSVPTNTCSTGRCWAITVS